jgi:hypothetical protein
MIVRCYVALRRTVPAVLMQKGANGLELPSRPIVGPISPRRVAHNIIVSDLGVPEVRETDISLAQCCFEGSRTNGRLALLRVTTFLPAMYLPVPRTDRTWVRPASVSQVTSDIIIRHLVEAAFERVPISYSDYSASVLTDVIDGYT